jgi:hypothetical protein
MPTFRQQHLHTTLLPTHNARMTEMRWERDRRVLHAPFDFGGEFLALFDAGAEEVDFCFQACQDASDHRLRVFGGEDGEGRTCEGWDWFEEEDWSETVADGQLVHGFLFELEAAVELAV